MVAMRAMTGRASLRTTAPARMLLSVNAGALTVGLRRHLARGRRRSAAPPTLPALADHVNSLIGILMLAHILAGEPISVSPRHAPTTKGGSMRTKNPETSQRIVDAAYESFWRSGFTRTSVDDI